MPLPDAERDHRALWLQLSFTPGVGPVAAKRLIEKFHSPLRLFAASAARLSAFIDAPLARALLAPDPVRDQRIARCLDWARADRHHLVCLDDPAYPKRLAQLTDPPPVLLVDGDPAALSRPALAIVGSRRASRSGIEHAQQFAQALGQAGLCVVSGLAVGIDAAAHRGALATLAGTVAVIGCGHDQLYPRQNRPLAARIADHGAVVSEFGLGEPPLPDHFPRRNRLIAALSLGVLVVEAARRSGSLITARLAGDLGADVFAIPGPIDSPLSRGCHHLIRDGATLVESAQDILDDLRPDVRQQLALQRAPEPEPPAAAAPAAGPVADPAAGAVIRALGWDPASLDQLVAGSGLAADKLASVLLKLQLSGRIYRLDDGRFRQMPPN